VPNNRRRTAVLLSLKAKSRFCRVQSFESCVWVATNPDDAESDAKKIVSSPCSLRYSKAGLTLVASHVTGRRTLILSSFTAGDKSELLLASSLFRGSKRGWSRHDQCCKPRNCRVMARGGGVDRWCSSRSCTPPLEPGPCRIGVVLGRGMERRRG
jgi:hypothetical protein